MSTTNEKRELIDKIINSKDPLFTKKEISILRESLKVPETEALFKNNKEGLMLAVPVTHGMFDIDRIVVNGDTSLYNYETNEWSYIITRCYLDKKTNMILSVPGGTYMSEKEILRITKRE